MITIHKVASKKERGCTAKKMLHPMPCSFLQAFEGGKINTVSPTLPILKQKSGRYNTVVSRGLS